MFLLRLLRRLFTDRFGFPAVVRAWRGTGGGRATPASWWEGLDMAGKKEGERTERGRRTGRRRGGRRYMGGGSRIRGQDQYKFAVRLGFIIDDAVNDITPGKLGSYSGG